MSQSVIMFISNHIKLHIFSRDHIPGDNKPFNAFRGKLCAVLMARTVINKLFTVAYLVDDETKIIIAIKM